MTFKIKYITYTMIISLFSIWCWVKYDNEKFTQPIQIHGKVTGLEGKLVLNIENFHLNLGELDRFTFMAYSATPEQLIIQVSTQPQNQHCQLASTHERQDKMRLKIHCADINEEASTL
ncbi:hypothetical protein CW745_08670 [Psychromonas sp. psych-6C06]|uniref:hypothetical protein n=1 Tax=Psychromonas sp. psych-6C06 TaxID=2058089 RepID=UPI000C349955|nr:hypothetical protein [Psychromonas sp. psych-6C06]PKF61401.1 hypothetical protein CW745_08670 [Psychromonas sp. psych-6C06]